MEEAVSLLNGMLLDHIKIWCEDFLVQAYPQGGVSSFLAPDARE